MSDDCSMFYFIAWGLVGGALCVFGFCGNILSFMAFQKDKRSSTTTLLQSLAVSDFLLLASVFITDSIPYICSFVEGCENPWNIWPYIRYIWILTPIAHMCSIWFVVLIALNRYWAVCHAVEMVHVWNNQRTPIYIFIVVVFVISFNMPRFFEYKIIKYEHTYEENNRTITEWSLVENRTAFGLQGSYKMVYKVLLVNIILVLVPIVLLIAFTLTILVVLHNTRRKVNKRAVVSVDVNSQANGTLKPKRQKAAKGTRSPKQKASQEITFILILVVVVAIICQAPLCVFHFLRYTSAHPCGHIVFYLDNISKLLVNVNSSINFIIYCFFSPKFRKLLISSLKCNCLKNQSSALGDFNTTWIPRPTGTTTFYKGGNNIQLEPIPDISPASSRNELNTNDSNGGVCVTVHNKCSNGSTSSNSNGHVINENGSMASNGNTKTMPVPENEAGTCVNLSEGDHEQRNNQKKKPKAPDKMKTLLSKTPCHCKNKVTHNCNCKTDNVSLSTKNSSDVNSDDQECYAKPKNLTDSCLKQQMSSSNIIELTSSENQIVSINNEINSAPVEDLLTPSSSSYDKQNRIQASSKSEGNSMDVYQGRDVSQTNSESLPIQENSMSDSQENQTKDPTYEDLDRVSSQDSPLLPKDFPSLLIPMRETVC